MSILVYERASSASKVVLFADDSSNASQSKTCCSSNATCASAFPGRNGFANKVQVLVPCTSTNLSDPPTITTVFCSTISAQGGLTCSSNSQESDLTWFIFQHLRAPSIHQTHCVQYFTTVLGSSLSQRLYSGYT